jgi:predicted dinucleotide-binding enzyme
MRIAIIGAGHVGGGLGKALAAVGHDVVFGVRDPESAKTLAALADIPDAAAASPAAAVAGADISSCSP